MLGLYLKILYAPVIFPRNQLRKLLTVPERNGMRFISIGNTIMLQTLGTRLSRNLRKILRSYDSNYKMVSTSKTLVNIYYTTWR